MKVVYNENACGLKLSQSALNDYNNRRKSEGLAPIIDVDSIPRHDELLVKVVNICSRYINDICASLTIMDIPNVYKDEYRIKEVDGHEMIVLPQKILTVEEYNAMYIKLQLAKDIITAIETGPILSHREYSGILDKIIDVID